MATDLVPLYLLCLNHLSAEVLAAFNSFPGNDIGN